MENKITNPHDKLFRETWSKIHVARDYFQNYLPEKILKFLDLQSLEIAKGSFIEKELEDYYSDILYKISVGPEKGYIYLLFARYKMNLFLIIPYLIDDCKHFHGFPKSGFPRLELMKI